MIDNVQNEKFQIRLGVIRTSHLISEVFFFNGDMTGSVTREFLLT